MSAATLVLAASGCGGGDPPRRSHADAAPDAGPEDAAPAEDASPEDAAPADAAPPLDAGGCEPVAIDVVYVVDTSPDMAAARTRLLAQLPATLDALRDGWGEHTLHVGVLSADLGTGEAECATPGDDAVLQSGVVPDAAPCDASYPSFLSDPVESADVACIGALEADGCAVQRPIDAVLRGLRDRNAGFLQAGSKLVVAVFAATEDCSTDDDAALAGGGAMRCYDPDRALISPGALADRLTTVRRPSSFFAALVAGVPEGLGGCEAGDFGCMAALPALVPVDEGGVPRAVCETSAVLARPTPRLVALGAALETIAPGHVALGSLCDEDHAAPFAALGAEIGKGLCVD